MPRASGQTSINECALSDDTVRWDFGSWSQPPLRLHWKPATSTPKVSGGKLAPSAVVHPQHEVNTVIKHADGKDQARIIVPSLLSQMLLLPGSLSPSLISCPLTEANGQSGFLSACPWYTDGGYQTAGQRYLQSQVRSSLLSQGSWWPWEYRKWQSPTGRDPVPNYNAFAIRLKSWL